MSKSSSEPAKVKRRNENARLAKPIPCEVYCRYHVVIVPKYRKKAIYGALRKDIGGILRAL